MTVENKKVMSKITDEHIILDSLIGNSLCHYLDIPIYNNIGDILIMFGTLNFLKKFKKRIISISSAYHFDSRLIQKNEVILFQGGGNMGDLYPLHQNFREKYIDEFSDNRIIILPQTIYYNSEEKYKKTCDILSKHKDLHICVRDKRSFELAKAMTKNVYLMPDMAHQLYPLSSYSNPKKDELLIKRLDIESDNRLYDESIDTIDWVELLKNHNFFIKIIAKSVKLTNKAKLNFLNNFLIFIWLKYAKYLSDKAVKLYSDYDKIITTRLHGHILACLMDKKNIVYDNSYGKNSSYVQLWTLESNLVTLEGKKSV